MKITTDFLVIGSGIAGLSYALHLADYFPGKQIIVLTKADDNESNTKYAQGGIAAVLDQKHDSFESHVADTLKAGDGLCNKEVAEIVVEEGPVRLKELMGLGTVFDRDDSGALDLIKEGGHSASRIAHYKDITGFEIQRSLLKQISSKSNITIHSDHLAIALITAGEHSKKYCCGVDALNNKTKQILRIIALITLIAAGGAGQLYQHTTNPLVATGDGIAMAYRASVHIKHMEFVQFHPTVLYAPGDSPAFLISEAVRGHGAILRNNRQEAFMYRYDERKELASRDIVARAIYHEMKTSNHPHIFLDCRHFDMNVFRNRFPNIYQKCSSIGLKLNCDMIPVVPAVHYLCGGIETDIFGRTSIENLYACGECACTGLHGANRLASNSLLEAVVFAYRCYTDTIRTINNITIDKEPTMPNYQVISEQQEDSQLILQVKQQIQSMMSKHVGIIRSEQGLTKTMQAIEELSRKLDERYHKILVSQSLCELRNLVTVAKLIVQQSLQRTENKGGFYKLRESQVE